MICGKISDVADDMTHNTVSVRIEYLSDPVWALVITAGTVSFHPALNCLIKIACEGAVVPLCGLITRLHINIFNTVSVQCSAMATQRGGAVYLRLGA